jgi:tetratricopeptide (TPR) repeat protein
LLYWRAAQLIFAYLLFFLPQSPALEAKAAGVRAAQQNNYSEAARQFGEACRLQPSLKDVCYYQGRALYYSNRFKDAIGPLEKSIMIGESAARAHSTIAECFEALGKPPEAEQAHRQAIREEPNPEYWVRFAIFLFRQGRANEAVEPLSQALKIQPDNFEANREMGRVLFEQDKLESALEFLNKALRARPQDTQAHLLAAKVCQRLGKSAEAAEHLKAAQVPEP